VGLAVVAVVVVVLAVQEAVTEARLAEVVVDQVTLRRVLAVLADSVAEVAPDWAAVALAVKVSSSWSSTHDVRPYHR
jgi:hypothetical protein